jgi:UV DNA damage endonuclease
MNLSLCCISNILAEQGHKFRTMTFKSFSSKERSESLEKLSGIIINNFQVSEKIVRHCKDNNIMGYRLSSDLCPVIKHPDVMLALEDLPNYNEINKSIIDLSNTIRETGIRVSAHPSEYITLTSDDDVKVQHSIIDLELHAEIFDRLNLSQSYYNPLNIHIRKEGEPKDLSVTFIKNFERLSDSVKKRLVLENNDTGNTWTVNNLKKYFYESYGIPVTFDNLHHEMLNHDVSHMDAFYAAYSTWNCTPIFHYSEGKNGTRAHSDMALGIPENYNKEVLFDVELKNKDYAILDIIKRYNEREILAVG